MVRKTQSELKAKITPDHPLFEIIEEAYRVFAYPKPREIGVCEGCCMYPKIEKDFFNPAIEDLPLHYLQDWFFAAYDPGGVPKATWGYLLPRILEVLAVGEEVASVGVEVSLARYAAGNPDSWTPAEWQVLDRFQRAYLSREMPSEGGDDFLDDTLCMFALGGWSLPELLEQVAAYPDEALARRLWSDWCGWGLPGRESIWITSFWEDDQTTKTFEFYTSRRVYDRMATLALADETPGDLAAKASAVAAVIEANADWAARP